MSLADQILLRAKATGARLATAESCTGGMVSAALSTPPGASAIFMGGCVTYSNAAKRDLLGVTGESLEAHGAVSEQVAVEMAEGALRAVPEATLAISVTGIAGPGASEFKPEGRVCFALARDGLQTKSSTVEFGALGRDRVRTASTDHALSLILRALNE